jgi:hypothetical protein
LQKLGELKLGELLDTPPPGLDEAIAISKACIFLCFMVIYLFANYPCNKSFFALLTFKIFFPGYAIS